MRRVPREAFLPAEFAEFAYRDTPLPIEAGQTISQPYIVALMIESVEPRAGDRALEIGTGSGYAAAVLSLKWWTRSIPSNGTSNWPSSQRNVWPIWDTRTSRFFMATARWVGPSMLPTT